VTGYTTHNKDLIPN